MNSSDPPSNKSASQELAPPLRTLTYDSAEARPVVVEAEETIDDTRINTNSTRSVTRAEAWGDAKAEAEDEDDDHDGDDDGPSRKRRKIESREKLLAAVLEEGEGEEDLGQMVGFGGTGQLFEYGTEMVLKIYVDARTFFNEVRAYSQLATSSFPHPIPHVVKSVLLPQRHLDNKRSPGSKYDAREFTPYHCGLVLQHLRGPLLCDFLEQDSVGSCQVDTLHQDIISAVQRMHEQGVSHGDIKGNNIMFRTQDIRTSLPSQTSNPPTRTHLPIGQDQNRITRACEDAKDWCIFDFGRAVFRSDCSDEDWKEQCWVDLFNIDDMFKPKRAQLAIGLLGQYLSSKVDSGAHEIVADGENCCFDGSHGSNQEALLSSLQAAEALPRSACPLVRLLLPRIPSPSLDLVETIVNIFCKANKPRQALSYLANQIKTCQQQLQASYDRSNERSLTFLRFKKLHVARKYYYLSHRHVTALQALLPLLEDRFGPMDIRTLEIKRELSLVMFDRGDKEQARLLYQAAVMLSEEINEVGSDSSEEKHSVDSMSGGVEDMSSHSQVRDDDNESPTRRRMMIKGTLWAWDKKLTEREEVIRKRAALFPE